MEVQRGRFTADIDGDFVVFLIGMRFNHPLRVGKWWPVATAMPRMLRVLSQHPELGWLGFEQWFGRTTILVQYWRDFDSLDRFAKDTSLPHLEPWRRSAVDPQLDRPGVEEAMARGLGPCQLLGGTGAGWGASELRAGSCAKKVPRLSAPGSWPLATRRAQALAGTCG